MKDLYRHLGTELSLVIVKCLVSVKSVESEPIKYLWMELEFQSANRESSG